MVHRIVFILLLLLLVFSLTAQQGELSAEEYQRRNVELQRLANRFKQETGFEGSIDIDHQNMTLSHFRGRFRDVVFPSQSDTMSVKQVGDIIIERLLPVLPAPKEQLSIERIGSWGKELIIQYQQTINGYQIEGAGFLRIFHDYNRDRTTILNVLVSIDPTPVTPRITEEEALNYFYSQIVISDNKKDLPYYKPITKLLYCPVIDQNTGSPALPHQYLLSWRIDIGGHRLVINAITGEKMYYTTTVRRDHVVNVRGTIYPNSDESVNLTPFTQDFDNAMVEIIDSLGTSIHWTQNGFLNYSGTNVQEIKSYLIGGHYEITNAIGQNIILSQAIADPNSSLTNFEHIPNPSNLFFYSNDFISFLNAFLGSNGYPVYLPFLMIQADYPFVSADTLGTFNASSNIIRIHTDAGQFRSTLSHEIMHAYVYTSLNYDFFNGIIPYCDTRDAMDEAFSMYYPCAYRDSPIYRHTAVIFEGLHSQTYVYPTPGHVMTEDCYSRYENRIPIASAWWELRSHFADFDQLLITTLGRVSTAHPDRYKPRYFFNLLMREVATDTLSWTINSDQQRIIDAYKDRGLHFYPSVITTGPDNGYRSATVKNIFDLGDPVYVSLTDFPQNTEVKIYLVKNQEYTDGMNIPAGFTDEVIETLIVMTDNKGKWQSLNPLWTPIDMNDAGEYDIIVDVENNGHLNFAFNGSNVRDGIKGLNEPGFIVEDRGIDFASLQDFNVCNENNRE